MQVTIYLRTNNDNARQFDDGISFSATLLGSVVSVECETTNAGKRFAIYLNDKYMTSTTSYKKAVGMATIILHEQV